MSRTCSLETLFRTFCLARKYSTPSLKTLWGKRDEFAWRRLSWLRGRQTIVRNHLGQFLRVRCDSLGDMYAVFGREDEKNIPSILRSVKKGGVVLDIGAHIGGFSLISAKTVGPSGHVFAFEPVLENIRMMKFNARLNQIDWLIPVHAAVGRKKGSVNLLVSDSDTMLATTRNGWADWLHHGTAREHVSSKRVPVVTVDDFLRINAIKAVDLAKIDVEAAEMDVLAGASASLSEGRIQELIVEVHGPTVKWNHVAALLIGYGYEIRKIGGAEMHAVLKSKSGRTRRSYSPKPITVALIGCGAVSERLYAPALDKLAGEGILETVALVDPNPERRSAVERILSTASCFSDLQAMYGVIPPDLAIIAAPHRYHENLVVSCLENATSVLCERPMATTAAECDRMIAAAHRANRVFSVGHFRRFFPSTQMLNVILSNGLLGQVRSFRVLEGETYSWPAQSSSFFTRGEAGGGVLMDAGVDTLDLLLWWLGEVSEFEYEDDAMGGVETNCRLYLKMKSGATGTVQLSRDWPLPNRYIIECEKGWLAYSYDGVDRIEWGLHDSKYGLDAQIRTIARTTQPQPHNLDGAVPGFGDCFANQLRNVMAAIAGLEAIRVTGMEARKSVALIEDCYRNRKLLDMAWLDQAEIQTARKLAND